MTRLHRYLFAEVFLAALMAIALFVFVILALNALRDLVGLLAAGRVTFPIFCQLIVLSVPYAISYALPLGLLTGIMIAFGRFSSSQEWTAMRSAGLSLYYLSAPIFALAGLGVLLSLAFNFYYTPLARAQYDEIRETVIRENPLNYLQPRVFIKEFPGFVIYIGERRGASLEDFWIWQLNEEKQVELFVRAERGSITFNEEERALILTLVHGTGEQRIAEDPDDLQNPEIPTLFFEELPIRLSLDRILGRTNAPIRIKRLDAGQLFQAWNQVRSVVTGDEDFPYRVRLQTQIHKNVATAFSIFSLAMVAIPLAIKVGRQETYANFALAFALALLFNFLMVVTSWVEGNPSWRPDLLLWIPNLLFQAVGLSLLARANGR